MSELKPGQQVAVVGREFIVLAIDQGRVVMQDLSARDLPDLAGLTPELRAVKPNRKERRRMWAQRRRELKKAKRGKVVG